MRILKEDITIGIAGPLNLKLLNWNLTKEGLPETNSFPLTSHLVNALIKRGYKVICYTNSGEISKPIILKEGNLTVCIGRTKAQPGRRIFNFERQELLSLIATNPSDIIYAFWSYEYAWASLDSGTPTIVSVHDVAWRILFTQPDIFRFIRWYMNQRVLAKAKYVAANSDYTYTQLSRDVKRKAQLLYNFYDSSFEESIPKGLVKQNYIVSISMGFTKRKGVPASLKAFAILRQKYPDLHYHLIGVNMEPGGEAHQYALKHNLTEGVKFLGPLPFNQLLCQVAQAKVMVHASVEESFGMAVLEAMVVGTPVVGGNKSGFIPQLLDYGNAGMLCDIDKPQEIARATEKLLTDDILINTIISNATSYAKENFSEEVVVDKVLEYMAAVLKKETPTQQSGKPDYLSTQDTETSKDSLITVHEV